jgi:hypothetical protein
MLRALLWKEWRELWALPIAAIPLAAMSFYLTKKVGPRITADVWTISFAPWLFLAATYIPTHLYARDKELDTAVYIDSMPLDRFRMWWLKLFVGLTIGASIGLVLYGTTTILCGFYERVGPFEMKRSSIIAVSMGFASFAWSLSAMLSSVLRKQLNTVIACSLCLVAFWMAWMLVFMDYRATLVYVDKGTLHTTVFFFSKNPNYWAIGFASLAFPLLLASLVHFARGNLWNQRRATLALAYGVAALLLATPAAAGSVHLAGGVKEALKPKVKKTKWIRLLNSSKDGSRLLLQDDYGEELISVDLSRKEVNVITTTDRMSSALFNENTNMITYSKWRVGRFISASVDIILSDFDGIKRRELFKDELASPHPYMKWSSNGSYLGVTDSGAKHQGKHSFTAISDSDGNLVWKREDPLLEDSWSMPIGWDCKSRFYYSKRLYKNNSSTKAMWRISLDSPEPKRVPLSGEPHLLQLSPNGKWIASPKWLRGYKKGTLWIYDVSADRASLLSRNMYSYVWSSDGSRVAYVEATGERIHDDFDEPLPARLVIYDPSTDAREAISLGDYEADEMPYLRSWSQTGEYILFRTRKSKRESWRWIPRYIALSLTTGEIIEMPEEVDHWGAVRWLPGEQIMWIDENRIVATKHDGSNLEELFRVENGTYYLYGKEQT